MSAQEMTPERLAEIRAMSADPDSGDNWCDRLDLLGDVAELLEHLDAITADRDEARQEVAALRAQRDEIREAHRVDEEERDSDALRRMATLAGEAQKRLSTLTEAVAWYLELRARRAGSNGAHAEGYANALRAAHDDLTSLVDGEPANARAAHLEALTARLEAAERERDEAQRTYRDWRGSEQYAELTARADAAEAKLAALVEAADLVVATAERQGEFDGCPIEAIASALRAVRGET